MTDSATDEQPVETDELNLVSSRTMPTLERVPGKQNWVLPR